MYDGALAKQLGDYIVERRKELGLTQKDLKRTLGFSAQFLGRIEKGKVMIPEKCMVKLINILELDYTRIEKIYRVCAADRVTSLFDEARRKKVKRA